MGRLRSPPLPSFAAAAFTAPPIVVSATPATDGRHSVRAARPTLVSAWAAAIPPAPPRSLAGWISPPPQHGPGRPPRPRQRARSRLPPTLAAEGTDPPVAPPLHPPRDGGSVATPPSRSCPIAAAVNAVVVTLRTAPRGALYELLPPPPPSTEAAAHRGGRRSRPPSVVHVAAAVSRLAVVPRATGTGGVGSGSSGGGGDARHRSSGAPPRPLVGAAAVAEAVTVILAANAADAVAAARGGAPLSVTAVASAAVDAAAALYAAQVADHDNNGVSGVGGRGGGGMLPSPSAAQAGALLDALVTVGRLRAAATLVAGLPPGSHPAREAFVVAAATAARGGHHADGRLSPAVAADAAIAAVAATDGAAPARAASPQETGASSLSPSRPPRMLPPRVAAALVMLLCRARRPGDAETVMGLRLAGGAASDDGEGEYGSYGRRPWMRTSKRPAADQGEGSGGVGRSMGPVVAVGVAAAAAADTSSRVAVVVCWSALNEVRAAVAAAERAATDGVRLPSSAVASVIDAAGRCRAPAVAKGVLDTFVRMPPPPPSPPSPAGTPPPAPSSPTAAAATLGRRPPPPHLYGRAAVPPLESALAAVAAVGDVDGAFRLHRDPRWPLVPSGGWPLSSPRVYASLITACSVGGQPRRALIVYRAMVAAHGRTHDDGRAVVALGGAILAAGRKGWGVRGGDPRGRERAVEVLGYLEDLLRGGLGGVARPSKGRGVSLFAVREKVVDLRRLLGMPHDASVVPRV
ncbi:hypothetical protein MMPV_009809 [Pyropia vietnamensis]